MRHTPVLWELFHKSGVISIYKGKKEVIKWTGFDASDYPKDALGNAKFIVQAANSHEALLEACEALVSEQKFFEEHTHQPGYMPGNQFYSDKFMAVVRMAKAAITKAKGEYLC